MKKKKQTKKRIDTLFCDLKLKDDIFKFNDIFKYSQIFERTKAICWLTHLYEYNHTDLKTNFV